MSTQENRPLNAVCPACDLVLALPPAREGWRCLCPRCRETLRNGTNPSFSEIAAMATAGLILLFVSLVLPFMSIGAYGVESHVTLLNIFTTLQLDWTILLWVFLFVTFLCPCIVLAELVGIGWCGLKVTRTVAGLYAVCRHYSMVDVFVVGIAVSLVKLTSLADVSFFSGFYTSIGFSLVLIWCTLRCPPERLWEQVAMSDLSGLTPGRTALSQGVLMCRSCGFAFSAPDTGRVHCPRCRTRVYARSHAWRERVLALLMAAIILYLPANLYPIMVTSMLGSAQGSNIVAGAIALWSMGSYFVALVILFASLFIPSLKILLLLIIVKRVTGRDPVRSAVLSRSYRLVEWIGKWSMIDVFVVILLAAIVQIPGIFTIEPGFAVLCFCAVVLITIFAAESFDERLIWDKEGVN